jgi:hypothetical protein
MQYGSPRTAGVPARIGNTIKPSLQPVPGAE